jgi:hypothetical protein
MFCADIRMSGRFDAMTREAILSFIRMQNTCPFAIEEYYYLISAYSAIVQKFAQSCMGDSLLICQAPCQLETTANASQKTIRDDKTPVFLAIKCIITNALKKVADALSYLQRKEWCMHIAHV